MDIYGQISAALLDGDAEKMDALVHQALNQMYPAETILEKGLVAGLEQLEERFRSMDIFVPDALLSARALNIGLESLRPHMKRKSGYKCTAVLGTVEGDYHDIGKNLVRIYISTLGIKVIDLGVDVSREEFVEAVRKYQPELVMLSCLLTTMLGEMEGVIQALKQEGLRDQVLVFVGGLPVSQAYADTIGADYYTRDAITLRKFLEKNLDKLLKEISSKKS